MRTLALVILLGLSSLPAVAQIVPQPTQLPEGVMTPGEQEEAAKQKAQTDLLKRTRAGNQVVPSETIMGEPAKKDVPAKAPEPAKTPDHPPCATNEACMIQVLVEKWFAAEVTAAKMQALQRVTPAVVVGETPLGDQK